MVQWNFRIPLPRKKRREAEVLVTPLALRPPHTLHPLHTSMKKFDHCQISPAQPLMKDLFLD
jgi:hypothetical protein